MNEREEEEAQLEERDHWDHVMAALGHPEWTTKGVPDTEEQYKVASTGGAVLREIFPRSKEESDEDKYKQAAPLVEDDFSPQEEQYIKEQLQQWHQKRPQ